ncbi:helix-turn-helix domain-containing protein [Streptomyces subrutilus]|uniref:helix-turn-helix domain-containing protein n=1 Tax=Streptomyces subrutilus TaxID=36818 RepID=UPI002E116980|nr:helix-turn-helix domain-containing protein [Streptomyces subrutilus]
MPAVQGDREGDLVGGRPVAHGGGGEQVAHRAVEGHHRGHHDAREALGMSPLRWVLQQRVRRAQQYLETSDRSVGWIAATCGFGGAASLRAHFARIVGMSPSAYRRAFHARADAQPLAG